MTGRMSRNKGSRFERAIVDLFQEHGLAAERVPLSGMHGGKYAGDVSVPILGVDRTIEAKIRATGFAQVYRWLADHYGVVIRADRQEPLICLRLKDFARLATIASRNEAEGRADSEHLQSEAEIIYGVPFCD